MPKDDPDLTAQLSAGYPEVGNYLTINSGLPSQADVRTLRQALGYCWSVAVAADPAAGLPAFLDLDETGVDLDWIVRTNRTKARLRRLLPT